jgi:hypothetical protein
VFPLHLDSQHVLSVCICHVKGYEVCILEVTQTITNQPTTMLIPPLALCELMYTWKLDMTRREYVHIPWYWMIKNA